MASLNDSEYPGLECMKYGIKTSLLLSSAMTNSCVGAFPEIDVSNKLVLELASFKNKHHQLTLKSVHCWLKHLYGKRWPKEAPSYKAIAKSIERLSARLSRLKKQHTGSDQRDEKISEFLQEEFVLPRLGMHNGRVVHYSPAKESSSKMTQQNHEMKQKMYAITRNSNKRLKRREETISRQKNCIDAQHEQIKSYEQQLQGAKSQLSLLRAKLDRVNHRAVYWKARVDVVNQKSLGNKSALYDEIKILKDKVSSLDLCNAELNDEIVSVLSSEEITTFEGGKYIDDVRTCIYELLSLNVGVRNVAPIIQCVLKNVAHKSASRLPSYGLTCQMIMESLVVAQAQLGEKLSQSLEYNTLQTDGTTKFGEHYAAYDVRMAEDATTYTLGLRHVFSGSAVDTLDTFKEILDDIDSVQQAIGKEAVSANVVLKIKNTMSDRHAAEKLFNELLEDYRADLLPAVAQNWDQMTDLEKEHLTRMNNFFCGLHYLVGLADTAEETVKVWEAQSTDQASSSSSTTQRLIRTACKAFHHRGSQQCGTSTLFRAYLRKEGIQKIPLAHFVGNRFNILFYDAAGVYYLHQHMVKFLKTIHGKQANLLLKSVLADLMNLSNIAGCRALGLIDKIVTGPLWRKLQQSSVSILQMSNVYSRLKDKFDEWSDDSSSILQGTDFLEDGILVHEDEVWSALIESTASDVMTQELLQLLFKAFSKTTQRLLLDHLSGGKYYSVTDDMIKETASVPTTNTAPERDFAAMDRLMHEKPNACQIALESMILYSHNKSYSWLEQQTCKEREKLIQAARTLAPAIQQKFKARRQELLLRREEALVKKQQAISRREMQLIQEKEKLTKEIEKAGGLWISRADIEDGLESSVSTAEKLRCLKLQIKFRFKVLGQTHPDKSVFKFSCNGKQHSIAKLKQNLFKLINDEALLEENDTSSTSCINILRHPELLVGRRIQHRFKVDENLEWFDGTVLKMNKMNEFQILYDGEEDPCWFSLLEDLSVGDLVIL